MTVTSTHVAAGTTFVAGAAILAYISFRLLQKKKKVVIPVDWQELGDLTEINLYPLKSGKLIQLTEAECTEVGIKQTANSEGLFQLRDRCLVVYTAKNNEFKTARTYPQLLHINVTVQDANTLAINAPHMKTLYVKIPTKSTNKAHSITLHRGEVIYSIDCGDEAAVWFSRYILQMDEGFRLGYHDGSKRRDITKTHKHLFDYYKNFTNFSTGLYQDFTSMSLINKTSVDDLSKKVPDADVTVHHFRPNLIVDGPNVEPYDEDNWEWIKIGDVVMRNIKDCTRCMMVTLNPETAARNADREPLKTLEKYRISNGPQKLPVMGIHLEVHQSGILKVGDKVFVSRNS